jgi:hypothetical protein
MTAGIGALRPGSEVIIYLCIMLIRPEITKNYMSNHGAPDPYLIHYPLGGLDREKDALPRVRRLVFRSPNLATVFATIFVTRFRRMSSSFRRYRDGSR